MPVSCRDLWYLEPDDCSCGEWEDVQSETCTHNVGGWRPLMRGVFRPDGRLFVTDSHLALVVDELDRCTDMPAPLLMTRRQAWKVTALVTLAPLVDQLPDVVFQTRYLDALEGAGYVIRPMFGAAHAHGILAGDLVVGVIMPVLNPVNDDAAAFAGVAATRRVGV